MAVNIGLEQQMIKASYNALTNLLADHFVLLTKTWNYHWNVKGISFHSYHTFIDRKSVV